MNSIGASIVTLLMTTVLFGSKRWALAGLIAGVLYLTQYQAIDVLGLNITAIRLLEVAGVIRVIARRELSPSKLNAMDGTVLLTYGYVTLVFLIRSDRGQGEILGFMVDAAFCYFIFRSLIESADDLEWLLGVLVVFLAPYVVLLLIETSFRHNAFTFMGGGTWSSELRGDRIRCMGSFRHPILLGTFGASLLPLYIALAVVGNHRVRAAAGIGLCAGIVVLANSGGPLSAAVAGVVGWLFWPARRKMHAVRLALVGIFIVLTLIMKAPIWYLPARVSLLSGGGGWHRSYLMDVAFSNLDQWWLSGLDLSETKQWFPYVVEVTGAADITNSFLDFGFKGGFLAIVLVVLVFTLAFRNLGGALRAIRYASTTIRRYTTEYLLWGLGCSLLVHIVTWFSVTYFDQMYVIWFMHLAAISSISTGVLHLGRRGGTALIGHKFGMAGDVSRVERSGPEGP